MSNIRYVWFGVIIAIFFWASNFIAIKAISSTVSPIMAATFRFVVAAVVLMIHRTWKATSESTLKWHDFIVLLVIATLGITIQNFSIFSALQYTSSMNASIVTANMPLAGILLSALLLNTHISRFNIMGVLISLFGVLLVITQGNITSLRFNLGEMLMMIALISGCLYTILSKRWLSHVPLSQQLRWMIGIGSIQMLIVASLVDSPFHALAALKTQDVLLIIYMGIAGTLIAYYFWMKGSLILGPSRVTSLFNLIPVFTLLINMVLGVEVHWVQIIGIAFVCFGVFVGNKNPLEKPLNSSNKQSIC
ncbi:DMT family transporter [Shewanella sp. VB17]|uniref:DMT family transporter n=1 Tax=Shewanella sp. VB17 TaxID=2739432 RepID=UPI0015655DF6|nr:DMT family transporter [Shewanella sp. VB17]NRD75659.1 DMT family transporter [Shewanella sp. VB17]